MTTTYLLTPAHFDQARIDIFKRRQQADDDYQRRLKVLTTALDALNALEAAVKDLVAIGTEETASAFMSHLASIQAEEIIAARSAGQPVAVKPALGASAAAAGTVARKGERRPPPRKLSRPSGETVGQVPPKWTEADQQRILAEDPSNDAALARELDRSVAAIKKQRSVVRARRRDGDAGAAHEVIPVGDVPVPWLDPQRLDPFTIEDFAEALLPAVPDQQANGEADPAAASSSETVDNFEATEPATETLGSPDDADAALDDDDCPPAGGAGGSPAHDPQAEDLRPTSKDQIVTGWRDGSGPRAQPREAHPSLNRYRSW
jgi:hypothetical protein